MSPASSSLASPGLSGAMTGLSIATSGEYTRLAHFAQDRTQSAPAPLPFKVRDFGHPRESPLHFGVYPVASPAPSTTSDIDNLFPCHARALYDFTAQDPSELTFSEGAQLYVVERTYPGWLLAVLGDHRGLVPENYICIDGQDTDGAESSSEEGSSSRRGSGMSSVSDHFTQPFGAAYAFPSPTPAAGVMLSEVSTTSVSSTSDGSTIKDGARAGAAAVTTSVAVRRASGADSATSTSRSSSIMSA
ncbi:cytoskeletal protein binding protein [Allomyces javanicus]|nr:cytoskeletal protein binding protein [Allomyces javanicus]